MIFNKNQNIPTEDKTIRRALISEVEGLYRGANHTKIIEELGILNGEARIDIAVVNGLIHGYEIKSDVDTLNRLPGQMKYFNSVLDKITIVVGKKHLTDAIKIIPEWWGISIARIIDAEEGVTFVNIRDAEQNPNQDIFSLTSLLWKDEAINILEMLNLAGGVRSKTRIEVFQKLIDVLDRKTIGEKVRECLCSRPTLKFDLSYMPCGD
jgi:hypothetical protein